MGRYIYSFDPYSYLGKSLPVCQFVCKLSKILPDSSGIILETSQGRLSILSTDIENNRESLYTENHFSYIIRGISYKDNIFTISIEKTPLFL